MAWIIGDEEAPPANGMSRPIARARWWRWSVGLRTVLMPGQKDPSGGLFMVVTTPSNANVSDRGLQLLVHYIVYQWGGRSRSLRETKRGLGVAGGQGVEVVRTRRPSRWGRRMVARSCRGDDTAATIVAAATASKPRSGLAECLGLVWGLVAVAQEMPIVIFGAIG